MICAKKDRALSGYEKIDTKQNLRGPSIQAPTSGKDDGEFHRGR